MEVVNDICLSHPNKSRSCLLKVEVNNFQLLSKAKNLKNEIKKDNIRKIFELNYTGAGTQKNKTL